MDRRTVTVFLAMCLIGISLFGLGVWQRSSVALILAILLFVAAPFVFGLRVRL
jgi:hypothetical protein